MNTKSWSCLALAWGLACSTAIAAAAPPSVAPSQSLKAAVDDTRRPEAERQRDRYRHPLQTLTFFGIKPGMTVVEIWPSTGWWSQILAPYLRDHGHYIAATPAASLPDASEGTKKGVARLTALLGSDPARFGTPAVSEFDPPQRTAIAPPGSVDLVVTFRNVHNWIGDDAEQAAFDAFFAALKPGGTLGVEEHRGVPGETVQQMKDTGYVPEAYVKALAANAGFKFVGGSNANDNPKDTKDYPNGVWTLPPSLRLGDEDRARYLAIGESDRMTLKFVKPK